jgi:peroxiredoxin
MVSRTLLLFLLALGLGVAAPAVQAEDMPALPKPDRAENFRLTDQNDRSLELYSLGDAPAVVLYVHGVGCPIVRQSVPALNRLKEEFGPKGVAFVMINANTQDLREDLAEEAEAYGIQMPILSDRTQRIALALGCKRTAEAIVLDPQDHWKILYRGAVDDRFDYGAQKAEATDEHLKRALTDHLAGNPVSVASVETKGCLIHYMQPEAVSYAADVAPILASKCVPCHTQGGLGPFAMSNQRKVRGWASMMRETIRTKRMPPWHADPKYGEYQHSIALSTEEERTLLAWIEMGAPKEEGPDPLRELDKPPSKDWTLGTPDLVVSMPREEILPAEGTIDYRYIYIDPGLKEDKWVRAAQVLPGTMRVVHHALIFIIYPEHYEHLQPNHRGGLSGYFEAFLPGAEIAPYPADSAQFVPAGSFFVFQMHYTATGKEERDLTKMALYFRDGPPAKVMRIGAASETEFEIPAHAPDASVSSEFEIRRNAEIWGVSPHMHYRGSRARFEAVLPDGVTRTLLNVPFYEFDWQPMYLLKEPVLMPAGSKIRVDGGWNNTKFNPKNPDPSKTVYFGEQSWEEMFIGYVKYVTDLDPERYQPRPVTREIGPTLTAENLVGTTWRIGRRYTIYLDTDGVARMNGIIKGAWKVDGPMVHLRGAGQDISVLMRGDQLLFQGHALEQVKAGAPKDADSDT